jgi:bifunctional enzyme CysN/CysC
MGDLRIAVAGHVDHGKSTLIGRLLYETGSLPQSAADQFDRTGASRNAGSFAFVTDQLFEEQDGSFTLDTTQAHCRTAHRDYTLIDTPGHREFLKNMVTGTTRADAAILVVDAAEGPLPQTYLHAYLISMLGIRQVIVAINKMDLVSYEPQRFQHLARHLSRYLESIGTPPVAVIPISAQQGDHLVRPSPAMPWNSAPPLLEAMDTLASPEQDKHRPLRFLVQYPFSGNGRRVILGKVVCGRLRQGQPLVFSPGRHRTMVDTVLLGQQEVDAATAGQSVGLLLEDPDPVERGCVGADPDRPPEVGDRLAARIFWIHPRSLGVKDRIEVLCGTQSRPACVEAIARTIDPISLASLAPEAACLNDSQVTEAVIRTESPICTDFWGGAPELGRFAILRDGRIAGGGVIAG